VKQQPVKKQPVKKQPVKRQPVKEQTPKKQTVGSRIGDWAGKKVDITRLAQIRCKSRADALGDTTHLHIRFDPLSFDDGLGWHQDEGIVGFELRAEVERGVIQDVEYFAEFCTCGGHAVGGRAPAWIFPSNPTDQVDAHRLPPLLRQRINCVLGMLTGRLASLDRLKKWHESTETGWSLPW
jgi:hypothetical protein